jgi:crossover junction endodeoxyribonuclease RuvC
LLNAILTREFSQILALDLSWSDTGWAIKNRFSPEVQYGSFGDVPGRDVERLDHVLQEVMRRVDSGTLVVIEDFAYAQPTVAHQLGGLSYLVRHALYKNDIPYLLIGPKQRTKFLCGNGNAKKEHVLRDVFIRYGLRIDNNNAADAITLNHVGQALIGWETPEKTYEQEVVDSIKASYAGGAKGRMKKGKKKAAVTPEDLVASATPRGKRTVSPVAA